MKKNEDSLRDLWENIKYTNIHIIGVPEGEEREKGAENIFENIIAEKFPNLGKETVTKSRKHREYHTGCVFPKRNTRRDVVFKITKSKDKILKAAKRK